MVDAFFGGGIGRRHLVRLFCGALPDLVSVWSGHPASVRERPVLVWAGGAPWSGVVISACAGWGRQAAGSPVEAETVQGRLCGGVGMVTSGEADVPERPLMSRTSRFP
ncbi:hypothetical protein GOB93_13370 [Acetobacter musti]|uniref:Uncharacterized protein n=1 Tax=Acetobacter musti TaxID=864732 RepID=A0ABX0JUD3_9PROT|nr:hypothetical protein [Acetobacter musti]NHN85623.1 hypothetical protein [Acetobacter musti]